MNKELLKVEIKLVNGKWQWMGKMSPAMLRLLCRFADALSDESIEDSEDV